jgi:hypothetical protein
MSDDAVLVDEEVVVDEAINSEKDSISVVRREQSAGKSGLKAEVIIDKLLKGKDHLKEVKNGLRAYRVTNLKIEELSAAKKELTAQINDEKGLVETEFAKDPTYNKLREEKLDAEEKIAVAKQELKVVMLQQVDSNGIAEVEVQYEGAPLKVQSQVTVQLFVNGKEEK